MGYSFCFWALIYPLGCTYSWGWPQLGPRHLLGQYQGPHGHPGQKVPVLLGVGRLEGNERFRHLRAGCSSAASSHSVVSVLKGAAMPWAQGKRLGASRSYPISASAPTLVKLRVRVAGPHPSMHTRR